MESNFKIDIVKIQVVKDGSIEYGKRRINNAHDLADLGLHFLRDADREMFILFCLNTKSTINCIHLVAMGTLDRTLVSPREIMKTAILSNAASIAFVHNHPSGDVEPSPEDVSLTKNIQSCAELFGIRVLDHVIVSPGGEFLSLAERGIFNSAGKQPANSALQDGKEDAL